MIEAHAVTVRAGRRVLLDGVDLRAPTGSVTGIVGPNGSGKTTLLRALLRAVPVDDGRVEIDGRDVRHRSRRWIAQRVASVAQRLDPDPALTVADEVALGGLARAGLLDRGGAGSDERVAAALDAVALAHRAGDPLAALSGGELQRVGLARAIAHGAEHVLLDEPTNHLDLRHRLEVLELLPRIAPTVVVVLHDLEVAARVCDHLVVLAAGRVVGAGPPADVLRPALLDAVYDVQTTRRDDPDGDLHLTFRLPTPPATSSAPPEGPTR